MKSRLFSRKKSFCSPVGNTTFIFNCVLQTQLLNTHLSEPERLFNRLNSAILCQLVSLQLGYLSLAGAAGMRETGKAGQLQGAGGGKAGQLQGCGGGAVRDVIRSRVASCGAAWPPRERPDDATA